MRSIQTIIAESASAYTRTKQQIMAGPSPHSIDDVITEDGILSYITSKLPIKEAVATCVLSPRWRNIWAYRPKLDFGAKDMFDDHIKHLFYDRDSPLDEEQKIELWRGRTDQFVCSVNSVIQQLQQLQDRSTIDEFKLRYFLNKSHSQHLDAWVSFAVESRTTMLGLYLHKPFVLDFDEDKYDFPFHLLGPSSSIEDLFLVSCSLKLPCTFNGLNNLKKLTLYRVDVTDEDIAHLLSNCYTLEYMRLHKILHLVKLCIPHRQSHFHTFIAKECDQLREIKIDAVNIRNLGYHGYPVDFIFTPSPQLLEAFFCFQTDQRKPTLDFYLDKIAANLPQLRTLTCTVIGDFRVPDVSRDLHVPKVFVHLRHLFWVWKVSGQIMGLWHLVTLLEAAPLLEKLSLSLWSVPGIPGIHEAPRIEDLGDTPPDRSHAHLKEVEFVSFRWDKVHTETASYLVRSAVELEIMSINNGVGGLDKMTTLKLRRLLPAKVKLKILNKYYAKIPSL